MAGQTLFRQQTALCNHAPLAQAPRRSAPGRRCVVSVKAEHDQELDRRAALSLLAGVATLVSVRPSQAAFGDAANVFGKATNTTGLIPYKGQGFSVDLPSKWGPSTEKEGQKNVVLRYEDSGDALNNVIIFKSKAGKGSVTDLGDPAAFMKDYAGLFGENVWKGATISEGGFKKDQVSSASLVDAKVDQKNGKPYYKIEVLTRAADGNEGGRHNLIAATVNGGELWICKVQIGDKRWFKGANKFGRSVFDSFAVA